MFDPTYPTIDMIYFKECDWKYFYKGVKEAIPDNAPESRGKDFDVRCFVDRDHIGDIVSRRSRTGFFIFINIASVIFNFKKQTTIETSVFGSEFVAIKTAMESVRGLRYKQHMMGVPLAGPTYMYGDNMFVIHNIHKPESMLKKKSNSICYHVVRETIAMGEMLAGYVRTPENVADITTRVFHAGQKRNYLVSQVLYDIVNE